MVNSYGLLKQFFLFFAP